MSMIRTHTRAWESVPRAAAEDLRLSVGSRGVLFWLLTRPSDWQVRIGAMLRLTGITKNNWPKIRDELISAGYLTAKKGRAAGKIVWTYDVYSVSIKPSPENQGMVKQGMVNKPSPEKPSMVLPSMEKQGTTDNSRNDTVISKEAHTPTTLPPLGEKEGQGQSPLKTLTPLKTLIPAEIARFIVNNPGLSLGEARKLRDRLDQQSEATL